jgi:hypothetical protein
MSRRTESLKRATGQLGVPEPLARVIRVVLVVVAVAIIVSLLLQLFGFGQLVPLANP